MLEEPDIVKEVQAIFSYLEFDLSKMIDTKINKVIREFIC